MKKLFLIAFIHLLISFSGFSQTILDEYISNYDYDSRKEMKVSSEEIVDLLQSKQAILLDIRFEEEQKSWVMPYAQLMPLPQLADRYKELDKEKLIVTACPHKERAIIAMMYLKSKGYEVKYLKDGLLGLADYLRGDRAKNFIENFE